VAIGLSPVASFRGFLWHGFSGHSDRTRFHFRITRFLIIVHAGAISVYFDPFASWGRASVIITMCHMGGVYVWVREDPETFGGAFLACDRWVEGTSRPAVLVSLGCAWGG